MKPKYKVTGCARFFLFFVIFVPIVYFGAAYFRGEDGVQKLKDAYHDIIGKPTPRNTPADTKTVTDQERIEALEKELREAEEQIEQLKKELAAEKAK